MMVVYPFRRSDTLYPPDYLLVCVKPGSASSLLVHI